MNNIIPRFADRQIPADMRYSINNKLYYVVSLRYNGVILDRLSSSLITLYCEVVE